MSNAVVEYLVDKVDGLKSDLESALGVIYRHGNREAQTWLWLNYPQKARDLAMDRTSPALSGQNERKP